MLSALLIFFLNGMKEKYGSRSSSLNTFQLVVVLLFYKVNEKEREEKDYSTFGIDVE